MTLRTCLAGALGLALLLAGSPASARVKLLTLPVRDRIEVHLENTTATLVEEERRVPLTKGRNQVDFSWANTRIDPATIVFRVVDGDARVLSVSYPPGENALVWAVHADEAGAAVVRISYLLGGLTRADSYRAVASADERTLTLRRYLELNNQANEGFGQATLHMADGRRLDTPIDLAETRKILVDRRPKVPIEKTYTVDVATSGYLDPGDKKARVRMHYVLVNDAAHRLGLSALPPGKIRIFQTDRRGTQAFLGEDWGLPTPIGGRMRLFLGVAQDVVVRRYVERKQTVNVQGRLHHLDVTLRYEVENFKRGPVRLDLVEQVAALRQEVGLSASRPSSLVIEGDGLEVDATDQTSIRMHVDAAPAKGAKAKPRTVRVRVRFQNEW